MEYPKNRNMEMLSQLSPFLNNQRVRDLIENTLSLPLSSLEDENLAPISGYYINFNDEIFSFYVIVMGRFCFGQLTSGGRMLNVSLPLSRIRRVLTELVDDNLTLIIEIDADQSTQKIIYNNEKLDEVLYYPSAYTITSIGDGNNLLFRFASDIKNLLI